MSTPDISRVIELIMQNPSLISEIQGMIKQDEAPAQVTEAAAETAPEPIKEVPTAENTSLQQDISAKARRSQLLSAMKSYVSSERARAIDSMLAVAEILEVMKAR